MMTVDEVERSLIRTRHWQNREHGIEGTHEIAQTIPVGTVIEYAGTEPPDGWLELDGRAVSRTQYADLFKAIGTQGGVGDGSATFNLPDEASAFTLNKLVFSGVD